MNIPDGMPRVMAGAHRGGPKMGACIMEYASYIAGEEWDDHPQCVNEELASFARSVNDRMTCDDSRARLVELLPRLMATGDRSDVQVRRQVLQDAIRGRINDKIRAGTIRVDTGEPDEWFPTYLYPDDARTDDDRYKMLETAIDAWEALYGRPVLADVDSNRFRELAALVAV